MRRRDFIAGIGSAAAAWPLPAPAQSNRTRRVAWLGLGTADAPSSYVEALRTGLRELGWIDGRNLTLSLHWATGRHDMEAAVHELLATDPEVIVAQEFMIYALRSLKSPIPQVFGFSGDPVDGKLVQSFARPGGHLTGMSYLAIELVGKRIELLKEWVPQMRRIAILARPQHPGDHFERQASEAVIRKLGLEMSYFPYSSQWGIPVREFGELRQAFAVMKGEGCDGLVVFPDTSMFEVSGRIAQYALEAELPSVSGWSPFAKNGLLLTYGPNVHELYRSLGRYVDRILRGAKPGDLPVERPTKIELVINLKTAKALRLDPPPRTLLARADEVIE